MVSDRQRRGNDWRTQPRDTASGQFKERAHIYAPRSEVIRIRVTRAERQLIEHAAEAADMSMTAWLIFCARRMAPPPDRHADRQTDSMVSDHQKMLVNRMRRGLGRR